MSSGAAAAADMACQRTGFFALVREADCLELVEGGEEGGRRVESSPASLEFLRPFVRLIKKGVVRSTI